MNKAAKLFKQAGCVSSDIKAALTSHIKHAELDIPEDAEEPKKVSDSLCMHAIACSFGVAPTGCHAIS